VLLAAGMWFSQVLSVSSTNKTDHHDIAEILLKVPHKMYQQHYHPARYNK
jgi:hypothetical protein